MSAEGDPSSVFLAGRLAIVEARVRAAVEARRAVDHDPGDRFRGLHISDDDVDALLAGGRPDIRTALPDERRASLAAEVEAYGDAAESEHHRLRLRDLARAFALSEVDIDLLLVALAPDLDPRFERLYGYLNDDVSRRRATTGLAIELIGGGAGVVLADDAPLIAAGLLIVEEKERPILSRSLRVPDRVILYLAGDDAPDPLITPLLTNAPAVCLPATEVIAKALCRGIRLVYVRERPGAAGLSVAMTALSHAGLSGIGLDLTRMEVGDVDAVAAAASREARFYGGGLIAGPIDGLAERNRVRAFAELDCPVILLGARGWDPGWSREVPLMIDAPIPAGDERRALWRSALAEVAGSGAGVGDRDVVPLTAQFRLAPEQIVRAVQAAGRISEADGRELGIKDLYAGARSQNAAGLERLARLIEPRATWDDLVLPEIPTAQLRELAARARHRELVLDAWGMAARSSKGRGVSALFAGESGTGKTMSAEILANELGLVLYVIDLSTVIDKYVGETEKNLERIFSEADRTNGILLFDEADAIFGKRSDVKDAHDRYANVEVAYLLQRFERFDGLAILTTNLRANVDEAFTRRLDVLVDFPVPEEDDRLRLWCVNLKGDLPKADDIDIEFLAQAFKVTGGHIRNICLTAAYLAADSDGRVSMAHLIRATEREYRKLGRLCVPEEFGPYHALLGA